MKVLIATPLFPPDVGGPATYSKALSEGLPKRGIEAEILSFGEVRHLPTVIRHIVYAAKICVKAWKAEVIYAQDALSVGWPATFASFLLRKPLLVKIVGDHIWEQGVQRFGIQKNLDDFTRGENSPHPYLVFLTWLRKLVVRRASAIVVPSHYLKSIVVAWGVPRDKIIVIYNSFEAPAVSVSKEEARNKLGLSGIVLISAGRLVPWKGFKTLLEIFPHLENSMPGAELFIAGEGPEKESLLSYRKEKGLEEKVHFLGQVSKEKLWDYIRAADAFVLNTSYEGLSHQLLETMALQTPIVTTAIGGNPELITEKEGFLVSPDDKEALVNSILKAVGEEGKVRALAAKDSLEDFSQEKMIGGVEALLRMVA